MLWPMAPWPRVRDWNDSAQPLTLGRPWGPWATRRAHFSWLSISLGSRSEDSVICKASDCNATRRWNTYENIMKQHWNNKEQLTLDIYWNIMILYIYNYIIERYSDTMCHVSHVSDRSSSTCIYSLNSSQVMKNNLRNTLREIRIGPNMTECIHLKKGEV